MKYEIAHHGIKGQKWGIRRYQNPDGSLTSRGRARYSKEFKKKLDKANEAASKVSNELYDKAYKKVTGSTKSGTAYEISDLIDKEYNKNMLDFIDNDKNYQKAVKLADKYDMRKWDDLAKSSTWNTDDIRKSLGIDKDSDASVSDKKRNKKNKS